ncbi:MAG TPA: VanW family protein [Gaiellaceae bacterium]|nr:VanW family protein [Gaiellaceae bacterium]
MSSSARSETVRLRRRRHRRALASPWTWGAGGLVVLAVLLVVLGSAFAGSSARLPDGVRVAGVDVGGLTPKQARRLLERRFEDVQRTPVRFTAGGRSFRLLAVELGIQPDFADAVDAARREGEGFGPLRGYKRLRVRLGDENVQPRVSVWSQAVRAKVAQIAAAVDRPAREAAVVRHGLSFSARAGRAGLVLDRAAASRAIVASLASFDRSPVELAARTAEPKVHVADLRPALAEARRAVSAPVRLLVRSRAYRLPRWRVAQLLELPADGRTELRIGGDAADDYFARLARTVGTKPQDATFAVDGPHVRVVPSKPGVGLDVPASAKRMLAAATGSGPRQAHLSTVVAQADRTTAEAQKMGIVGIVGSYETIYGGESNRRHNVQLVAHLVDNHLIKPGEEFSFNKTTGERTAAKGFLEAPVIVNGELETGLGGGVCQVSTTVFNAAFEAGLSITERTNHALYISHYPLGRDATVDYPSLDLKFVNDTDHWLLLRTFVGPSSLVVSLYGTPTHRRVEVETAPLRVVGPAPVEKQNDPELEKGQTEVEEGGVPAQATSVRRRVYAPGGKLLYDTTWYSSYRAEPEVVLVGTKKPKPDATEKTKPDATEKKAKQKTQTATTPQTQSTPTATTAPASA